MHTVRRRPVVAAVAAAAAAMLALSACSAEGGARATPASTTEKITLSFSWWGNDARTAATKKVIDLFEAEHPNITIEPTFTDFGSYWDKLATETAAKDAPDIIQMDEKYIATYGAQGALADLTAADSRVDTTGISKNNLNLGTVDGTLYGVPVAVNSYAIVVNKTLLKTAGVAIPDDKTWTWDDLAAIAKKVSDAGAGAYYGLQALGFNDSDLIVWARQHGDKLYDDKGKLAVKEKTLTDWWTYLKSLTDSGATPSASASVEKQNAGLSASFAATNKAAFSPWWNNQLTALTQASGSDLALLRLPTTDGKGGKTAYEKASMYWTISSRSAHPVEAAEFVDFLLHDSAAADVLLTERGVPANEKVRKDIQPKLTPTDKAASDFLAAIAPNVGTPPVTTPPGGSAIQTELMNQTQQVLFGQETPDQAAKAFIKNMKAALSDAQ